MYWILGMVWLCMAMPREVYAQGKNYMQPVNGVTFEMVYVKGGTFMMGATEEQESDAENVEKPAHQVTLSDYYIGKFLVTQGVWKAVMGSNPSTSQKGDNYPVESISWNSIQTFLTKLSQQTGRKYTLPTEAQWEYAARGGSGGDKFVYAWCGGGVVAFSGTLAREATKYSGSNNIDEVAWYVGNSGGTTHPVGMKKPNALGIYDMSGNVLEWCSDWFGSYSSRAQTNPTGPSSGSLRIVRGSGYGNNAIHCRVSSRGKANPAGVCYGDVGFRVVYRP